MRRLPAILLGAFILPVGLLPIAAFADTTPDPVVASTAAPEPSATVTPEPTATVAPEPSPTAAPTEAPTAEPTPTPTTSGDPGDPGGQYLSGQFGLKPASGPPGTVIKAKSKTACVDSAGVVAPHAEFLMLGGDDLESEDGGFTVDKTVLTDSAGAWKTKAKIPSSAKSADIYVLIAACFDADTKPGLDAEPFLVYDARVFTVTDADKAPVAKPVPGDPTYTG